MERKWILPLSIGVAVLAVVLVCLCLFAPGSDPAPTDPTPSAQQPTLPTATQPAPTQTQPAPTETQPAPTETVPPETQPPVLYTNPLTGEAIAALYESRPYAVVMNNIKAAMPQHGISGSDVLIEVLAEGGVTRCLAVFSDITKADALGSIRSARPYMIQLAQGFDAILIHAGASAEGREYLKTSGWNNLDGVKGTNAGKYFYRDQDRLNAGYSQEHTLFITSDSVAAYTEKLGYDTVRPGGVTFGWQFGDSSAAAGGNAASITVHFGSGSGSKSTSLAYNTEDGLYYASQYGSAHIDGTTGEQLAYRNVLVLNTKIVNQNDASGHLTVHTTGSGTGHYACDGKLIPIRWSRESVNDPFVFTTEDGQPLVLGIGKTYMAIVPNNALLKTA